MFKMILASLIAVGMGSIAFAQEGGGDMPKTEEAAPAPTTETPAPKAEKHAMKKEHAKKMAKKHKKEAAEKAE